MYIRKSHKIPAHTLSEVLVVLVITSLVVGIAFTVLRLVHYQFQKIEVAYTDKTTIAKFKQRLYIDIDKAHSWHWNDQEMLLDIKQSTATITYEMGDSLIMRNEDTIFLKMVDYKAYLKGKEVKSGALDALRLTVEIHGKRVPVFFQTLGSSTQYMPKGWE